jgi:hypothetical protein
LAGCSDRAAKDGRIVIFLSGEIAKRDADAFEAGER